jgi:hypothetical protein
MYTWVHVHVCQIIRLMHKSAVHVQMGCECERVPMYVYVQMNGHGGPRELSHMREWAAVCNSDWYTDK